MTLATQPTTALDERLIESVIGALELFSIHLGRNLGLHKELNQPRTVLELVQPTDIDAGFFNL